jgi:hypothetical protein
MVEGLNIVRFNGIYYIRFVRSRGSYENLGHEIIEGIPTDPGVYPGTSWFMEKDTCLVIY